MTRPFAARLSDLVARLVPRLTFDEPLESEFRHWHAEHTRSRVRNAMWLAMGNMLVVMLAGGPFRDMRDAIFGPENQLIVDVLRFGFIVPSCLAMLLVSYTTAVPQVVRPHRADRRAGARADVRRDGHPHASARLLAELVDAARRAGPVFPVRHAARTSGAHLAARRRWRTQSAAHLPA